MNTYESMGAECDCVSSEEPLGVHSLVPVTPVLNYLFRLIKGAFTYLPFMLA
jgi:hypothetical protein